MVSVLLHEFIATHREELIARCKVKVGERSAPTASEANLGVPLFLDQLIGELRNGPSKAHAISQGATEHGRDLLLQGFTVSQVVHDYGDVCQSVTDLAVEKKAPIDAEDFRTLNRCLDEAIASAVTEHAHGQSEAREGQAAELRTLVDTAISALEAIQSGRVGFRGATGTVLRDSLASIRALTTRKRRLTDDLPKPPER